MAQISREEFERLGHMRRIGQRRNDDFEPENRADRPSSMPILGNPAEQRAANDALIEQALLSEVNQAMDAARGGVGVPALAQWIEQEQLSSLPEAVRPLFLSRLDADAGLSPGQSQYLGPLALERQRRALMDALLATDPAAPRVAEGSGAPIIQEGPRLLAEQAGISAAELPPELALAAGRHMEMLGIKPKDALDLASLEMSLRSQGYRDSQVQYALADFMRERGLFDQSEYNTEVRRFTTSADPENEERFPGNDPSVQSVRHPLVALSESERVLADAAYSGKSSKNPFDPQADGPEVFEGGVPVLTALENSRSNILEDGRYRMEAPRQFIPKLDPDYKRALAQMETLVATMNPNAAQFPVAANALRELRANPQYSVHGENSRTPGQIVQTRALGLTQAGLNVINPTAPSLLSDSVRRVSRPSTFTTGSYEIAGVPLPDVGQEAHGFEAYHDPGADRGDEYEQMSVAQRWRQDMLDGMTPIKSYVIPSTDLAQVPVWPGSTDRGVLAPKEGAPMVARTEEGDLHLVVPRPTGQTLPDTTPLFEHRLGPKLDPMQTPPEVAPDGTITQAFRVSQNKPNELVGMITVKGWEDFGRNFADEARAAGIAPRSSEVANPYNLGLLANQKLAADRPVNKLQAALLDRAVDRNPNAGRRYAGSFPAARTVASPAVRPDPGAGQLYPIVKAVTQQSALPINHRLSAFEPEDSPVVREYLDMAEPMARKILEQRANWRQSVGLRGDGVTAEATWPKNSLLGHSARSAARLQGSAPVAGFTPAMLASLPERVQGQVRSMLRPDGSTNAHGLHWLATFGQRYGLTRPQASASTESPREPGDPNAWHQDFQRIPAARAPMGDSPLHVSGDEAPLATPGQVLGTAPRQVPQRRVAGAALSGPVDEMVPQVSYVPSERGLYVIGPEGTRLHAPAMDAADEKFAAFVRQRLAGRRL